MRFQIREQVYEASRVDDLTLKMLLELERETERFAARPIRMGDLKRMTDEIKALRTEQERLNHPDAIWMLAIVIWASRRLAGESIPFDEAIDFPLSKLVFLPDAEDLKEDGDGPKAKAGTRSGSGRAAAQRTRTPRTPTT